MISDEEERERAWKRFEEAEETLDAYVHGDVYDPDRHTQLTNALIAAKNELLDLMAQHWRK